MDFWGQTKTGQKKLPNGLPYFAGSSNINFVHIFLLQSLHQMKNIVKWLLEILFLIFYDTINLPCKGSNLTAEVKILAHSSQAADFKSLSQFPSFSVNLQLKLRIITVSFRNSVKQSWHGVASSFSIPWKWFNYNFCHDNLDKY